MKRLTLFSAPKPFTDPHIAAIQRNAIRSWLELGDEVQVFLVGEEPGLADAAAELGVGHLPQVRRNSMGTPLVSSIFQLARQAGDAPLLAYVNADILLLNGFLQAGAALSAQAGHFLLVGQRWDLEVNGALDFSPGWQAWLEAEARRRGSLHVPAGSDYFIFPRACFTGMPDFAIGRAGWDNWMIYESRRQGWLTVDATQDVFIVHQQHDYAHLPGGRSHHRQPETEENIRLAGGRECTRFSLLDVDRRLIDGHVRGRAWSGERLRRAIETYPLLKWHNYRLTERITRMFHQLKYKFRPARSAE